MSLRVLFTVFLLSVPLARCLTNSTSPVIGIKTARVSAAANVTVKDGQTNTTVVKAATVNVTSPAQEVQRPQLSSLDRYLQTQRSFVIANADNGGSVLGRSSAVQNVTSENYPLPYSIGRSVQRLLVSNSTGMNIIINDLDIDPTSDFISLTPVGADGKEARPIILTGKLKQPLSIRSLGYTEAKLVFEARTIDGHVYKGFSISYAPYGEAPPPGTQPPDVTLSYEQLDTISKFIVIPKENQTDLTWLKLKQLLANSTNSFVKSENLTLEAAFAENVTITRVGECFQGWPEAENCVEVEFGVTLYNSTNATVVVDPYLEDLSPREPAGLSALQLELMWQKFARSTLEKAGITEYELPDTRTRILMWVGIAIGCCVLLFLIFVAVFRSPMFRDRWVEDDAVAIKTKDDDSRKDNDDITMYPSPDQVIPELYPGNQTTATNGMDVGRIRQNTFETINEGYVEDDEPTTRIKSRRTEQSQADASV